ncbi:MAG: ATP-dependent sacrificial sulfur transferase LarE [Ignavibacteriales bacterium]|nr:ATP-dependent sacrificial sulfur transferase LarE [Ignavibacteriales bacterium]MCB9219502.1 ATP-dependent sacrificial sulfur transferase LarE [Ignavibacteriales bacterium]
MNNLLNSLEIEYKLYNKVLIALSGGVDSCLAAFLGRKFLGKENAIAVISNSPSLKERDYKTALNFCNEHDIKFEVIYTQELENENYSSNPLNRCYFCKSELYEDLNKLIKQKYIDFTIINGNNYSDLGDYRPGLSAAKEKDAKSPFISCKITKDNIRNLAYYFNLSVWDKPASPCLSSRFPYGENISYEKLKRVEQAEEVLYDLGFEEVRVRSFGDLAKIEIPKIKLNELVKIFPKVAEQILQLGFSSCEIDYEGLVSGKLNRVLNEF